MARHYRGAEGYREERNTRFDVMGSYPMDPHLLLENLPPHARTVLSDRDGVKEAHLEVPGSPGNMEWYLRRQAVPPGDEEPAVYDLVTEVPERYEDERFLEARTGEAEEVLRSINTRPDDIRGRS